MADFYVSHQGNARWTGTKPEPAEDRRDGPFPSITEAKLRIRALAKDGKLNGPVNVWIRGGVYGYASPEIFTEEDFYPVTYAPFQGEQVILDGGGEISGWSEETIGGIKMWTADLPEGRYFNQLFVNEERRPRTRVPEEGYFRIKSVPGMEAGQIGLEQGSDRFVTEPGDIDPAWKNFSDCSAIVMHWWVDEHMPLKSFDPATGELVSSRKSIFGLINDVAGGYAYYYVENVFEALKSPGQWYLDRSAHKLHYIPMEGETPENTVFRAPAAQQLIKIEGRPAEGKFAQFQTFKGLIFRNCDWIMPEGGMEHFDTGDKTDYASSPQASSNIPAVIEMTGAHNCTVTGCEIRNCGFYAVELKSGCTGNYITHNRFYDMGAGGVKLSGENTAGESPLCTRANSVTDNRMHKLGRVFASAVGILSIHSAKNDLSHNEIHDLYYSGISCGWVWGYEQSGSFENRIEKNHIYDVGQSALSDIGGIYTLGVQPGTTVRGNLIHDVYMRNYGGWGIYTDQGSSHILIENNIVYDTGSHPFHQNMGRENIVRNNIFAFGVLGAATVSTVEPWQELTYDRNIFVTDGRPMFTGRMAGYVQRPHFIDNCNLFWNYEGEIFCADQRFLPQGGSEDTRRYTVDEVKAMGRFNMAVFEDPGFAGPQDRNFALAADSPARMIGFRDIDMSDVGPREQNKAEEHK